MNWLISAPNKPKLNRREKPNLRQKSANVRKSKERRRPPRKKLRLKKKNKKESKRRLLQPRKNWKKSRRKLLRKRKRKRSFKLRQLLLSNNLLRIHIWALLVACRSLL